MQCRKCPYSMVCLSGRPDMGFLTLCLCPECTRLFGIVDNETNRQLAQTQREAVLNKRIEEAKKHGIDLTYETTPKTLFDDPEVMSEQRYRQEFMAEFVSASTTVVMLRCEKRFMTRALRQRWRDESARVHGNYRYTSGWQIVDPAETMSTPLNIRPCPECCRWPDYHIIEDLDEKERYEAEKERARPAFGLSRKKKKSF